MSTLASVIAEADSMTPNALTPAQKTTFINRIEGRVLSEIMDLVENTRITLVDGVLKYEIPNLTSELDVVKVRVDLAVLTKIDARSDLDWGYMITLEDDKYYITLKSSYGASELIVTVQQRDRKLDYSTDSSKELLIPVPYDDIYVLYLNAMIYHHAKDYEEYNNNAALYNDRLEAFKIWYNRRKPKVDYPSRNVW